MIIIIKKSKKKLLFVLGLCAFSFLSLVPSLQKNREIKEVNFATLFSIEKVHADTSYDDGGNDGISGGTDAAGGADDA